VYFVQFGCLTTVTRKLSGVFVDFSCRFQSLCREHGKNHTNLFICKEGHVGEILLGTRPPRNLTSDRAPLLRNWARIMVEIFPLLVLHAKIGFSLYTKEARVAEWGGECRLGWQKYSILVSSKSQYSQRFRMTWHSSKNVTGKPGSSLINATACLCFSTLLRTLRVVLAETIFLNLTASRGWSSENVAQTIKNLLRYWLTLGGRESEPCMEEHMHHLVGRLSTIRLLAAAEVLAGPPITNATSKGILTLFLHATKV
jgi:hypothetical protein